MMKISNPIEKTSGIGPVYKEKLKKMGIRTVGDLLFHLPIRYEDFSTIAPVSKLSAKKRQTVQGKIKVIQSGKTPRKRVPYTEAIVEDASGAVRAIWFYQPYLSKILKKGEDIYLSGKPSYRKNGIELINPTYEKIKEETLHTGGLVAIYPETEGISSRWLRKTIKSLMDKVELPEETLPKDVLKQAQLIPLKEALRKIHFPINYDDAKAAKDRFSFERIFYIQLASLKKKALIKREEATPIEIDLDYIKDFVKSLPFKLTDAQKKASWKILKDLEKPYPMNRLLEGDVGSGKTVVAVIAALATAKSNHQVAIMAPTEVLATQHFKKISDLLKEFRLNVGFLTGKKDKYKSKKLKHEFIEISRKKLLEKVGEGEIDLLIGTHALIQDKVVFDNLGLVIVDEQHRFGVKQRAKLCKKKKIPHLLSMTATPIPRTLALTLYGDLDISIINELPLGRKKTITKLVSESNRKKVYSFIEKETEKGNQVFFICPKIEDSEKTSQAWANVKSIEEVEKNLRKIFSSLRVESIHGKLSSTKKAEVMDLFKNGKTDILVSTSVIEVGVDIPNATVIIIEGAEMFGLAQLHQFRGRVGRSDKQSYCFLFSGSKSKRSRERLQALIESDNSFELAERDLSIRGPGDLTGKRQWGVAGFTMEALKNRALVERSKEIAEKFLKKDTELEEFPIMKKKIKAIEKNLHLE